MADTDTETLPNGTGTLSEEDERMKQRPADIDADVRDMERRKRVEALMSSKLFREELERVLDQQIHEGGDAPLLQRLKEMVGGRLHSGSLRGPTCVLPINDIRGMEGVGYEKGEKILRCKLAAVYRLVDLFGWTQTGSSGQITARLNTAIEQVLTTPRGLLPHEVTASSLVKVDMQGVVQLPGTTNFPVNVEGFSIHGGVHSARPDVRCVLHVRAAAALAVSATRRGLLPLCHEAAALGDIAYHSPPYGVLDNEEQEKLVRALGPHSKVLMLSSNGALCCGSTLEEAFYCARNLVAACDVQLRLASVPLDELAILDEETRRQMYEASRKPPSDQTKWRVGGEEFEALMRMLDNAGFRTGYIYRHPLIKNEVPKPRSDVEVPPAVSSLGYLLEEEELYRQGFWKKGGTKGGERTRWLNSPNVYQKVEVLETGTNDPRKITKWVDANNEEWVQDGSPAHSSTPVKIDTLQFVPKNTNPKEFKALQQQIKDNRRADKISAGPQSHILETVTWDEASKLVGEDAQNTHTGDHVVLMGAASKGIIQRGYQHNATVYSAPYARNPFDHITDNEIDEYKRTVERKQRSDYDTDLSESEALSAAQLTSPASARARSETEDESRDEHRVLRIETKQVPVRSQPEVVLSDEDTTDFLNAERAHADRTKDAARDQNVVLSDDEVFYDRPASMKSSAMMPPMQTVTIRHHQTAVQQTVVRGTTKPEADTLTEALSASNRNYFDYSRTSNFDTMVKKFDHPKCKVSLQNKLDFNADNFGSRSSLCSVPSLEWDGKCRSEYLFRARSLPRQRKSSTTGRLYRTQSHGGFVNFNKTPEPTHFHLPRCRSCGAQNSSYVWELTKDERFKKVPRSLYMSYDNIPQKCFDEKPTNVKVKEMIVPVFKVAKLDADFVDSQEFAEDNYVGDLGNSFSSENQTVIEKLDECSDLKVSEPKIKNDSVVVTSVEKIKDQVKVKEKVDKVKDANDSDVDELHWAECAVVVEDQKEKRVDIESREVDNSASTEGEYHSFTDELDFEQAVYESPVKDLMEKDIRDYTIPIDCYYDEYKKESPKNSPNKLSQKRTDNIKVLEPILEESKSSYDDSGHSSSDKIESSSDASKDKIKSLDAYPDTELIQNIENTAVVEEFKEQDIEVDIDNVKTILKSTQELERNIESLHKQAILTNESDASNQKNTEEGKTELIHGLIQNIFNRSEAIIGQKEEMYNVDSRVTTELLATKNIYCKENYYPQEELLKVCPEDSDGNKKFEGALIKDADKNISETLSNEAIALTYKGSSIELSSISNVEARGFDSTVEFEKYEVVVDVLFTILRKIDDTESNIDVLANLPRDNICDRFNIISNAPRSVCSKYDATDMTFSELNCNQDSTDFEVEYNLLKLRGIMPEEIDSKNISNTTPCGTDERLNIIEQDEPCSSNNLIINSSSSPTEEFSIAKIVQDIEMNDNMTRNFSNETILTESSDSEYIFALRIVESIIYYVLSRAIAILKLKSKKAIKGKKKVVTVVDAEDILYTANLFWLEKNISGICDLNVSNETKVEYIKSETANEGVHNVEYDNYVIFDNGDNNVKRNKSNDVKISENYIINIINVNYDSDMDNSNVFQCGEKIENNIEHLVQVDFHSLQESNNKIDDIMVKIDSEGEIVEKNIDTNQIDIVNLGVNTSEEKSDFPCGDNRGVTTDVISNDNETIDISLDTNEDCNNNVLPDNSIEISLDTSQINISEIDNNLAVDDCSQGVYFTYRDIQFEAQDKYVISHDDSLPLDTEDEYQNFDDSNKESVDIDSHEQTTFILEDITADTEQNTRPAPNNESNELDANPHAVSTNSVLNKSFIKDDDSAANIYNFDETHVMETEPMNTAFLDKFYGRSSSPNHDSSVFENCTESPIKDNDATYVVKERRIAKDRLYSRDDSILDSPFTKRVSVISMKQTVNSGGIKYWLSFDDSLAEDKPSFRSVRRSKGNDFPSFLTIDFDDAKGNPHNSDDGNKNYFHQLNPDFSVSVDQAEGVDDLRRASVLQCDQSQSPDLKMEDGYACASTDFNAYDFDRSPEDSMPKKVLLYDSKLDLHTKKVNRHYASWPPFEDTLFYRIISQFRMSQSFDAVDLENLKIDNAS